MFHPATVIQLYCATSCRLTFDALNWPNTQSDRANTTRDVPSATQRITFFLSLGMKSRTSTPTSGKKVINVRGCRKKFMFDPRFYELFQNEISDDKDNAQ